MIAQPRTPSIVPSAPKPVPAQQIAHMLTEPVKAAVKTNAPMAEVTTSTRTTARPRTSEAMPTIDFAVERKLSTSSGVVRVLYICPAVFVL